MNKSEKMMSATETADALGIKKTGLYYWICRQWLDPPVKVGRQREWTCEQIEAAKTRRSAARRKTE